jgi:hypothetical protein
MNKEKKKDFEAFLFMFRPATGFLQKKKKKGEKKNHPKIAGLGRLREPLLITLFDKIMGKYIYSKDNLSQTLFIFYFYRVTLLNVRGS